MQRPAELLTDQLLEARKAHRRHVVAEGGEPCLQTVALIRRNPVELDEREHLTDLHRGASHLPQLIDELIDQRGCPLALSR